MSTRDAAIWELPDDDDQIEGLDEHGEPDPAYAAALGLVPAPLGRRALAALIDIAAYCLLQIPYWIFSLPLLISFGSGRITWYGLLNHPNFILAAIILAVTALLSFVYCVVQLVFHGRSGVTLGKSFTGLRSVNVKTLERPGFWRVAMRAALVWGSAVVVIGPLLFVISPLFDPHKRGRGWHDLVGQTWMVDVRRGLQPYDKKRLRIARKTVTAAPAPQAKALPSLATRPGEDPKGEYRPAARTSAGVLGVARPHGAGPRPVIGLSGLEPSAVPQADEARPRSGKPVIGGYLASQQGAPQQPEQAPESPRSPQGQPIAPPPRSAAQPPAADVAASRAEQAPTEQGPRTPAGAGGSVERPPEYVVKLDTGQRVDVSGPVVVGRMPSPVEGSSAVQIKDEDFSVSKTHAALRPVEDGVEIVDQGSTNGTAIVHRGRERELSPGEPAVAVPGDTIRLGDRSAVVIPA